MLHDGSLGLLTDISDASAGDRNRHPVLASNDNNGHLINYGWFYNSTNIPPVPGVSKDAYIGLKMKIDGLLMGPSTDYWIVQDVPENTSDRPSLAFSTENSTSPELFMAFTQLDYTVTGSHYMGNKTVPWANTAFRPGNTTNVGNLKSSETFSLYPNPFTNTLQLKVEGSGNSLFTLEINDIMGRTILEAKGTAVAINQVLSTKSSSIVSGTYFAKIIDAGYKQTVIKLVKQ